MRRLRKSAFCLLTTLSPYFVSINSAGACIGYALEVPRPIFPTIEEALNRGKPKRTDFVAHVTVLGEGDSLKEYRLGKLSDPDLILAGVDVLYVGTKVGQHVL